MLTKIWDALLFGLLRWLSAAAPKQRDRRGQPRKPYYDTPDF